MAIQTRAWLDAAIQQMVAECYLDGINLQNADQLAERLRNGNNDIRNPNVASLDQNNLPGQTRLTDQQIKYFTDNWQIVDHRSDDDLRFANTGIGNGTGFSATLFRNKLTNEYTLSFRSTEYADEDRGGDWQRDGLPGAGGEIAGKGFALGQIAPILFPV